MRMRSIGDQAAVTRVKLLTASVAVSWHMKSVMRRVIMLPLLLGAGALAMTMSGTRAQEEPRVVAIQSMDVGENLYVISGGGGHTAMYITDNHGVVLVDTKNPGWGAAILNAVQAVTDQPVTTIINTHAHGDHTGSNGNFPGVSHIVAHENVPTSMVGTVPTETYVDRLSLFEGRDQIDLYYSGAAHTNGDSIVVFPAVGTAHVGDLFAGKTPPYIDRARGGSGVAYPETLAKAVSQIDGVTRVIPGHAPPPPGSPIFEWMTWDDLRTHAMFTEDLLDAVRDGLQAGQNVDETASQLNLQEKYPEYDMTRVERAVEAIYDELQP